MKAICCCFRSVSRPPTPLAPAPRFGRTPSGPPAPPVRPGSNTREVLTGLGLTPAEITGLQDRGAVS